MVREHDGFILGYGIADEECHVGIGRSVQDIQWFAGLKNFTTQINNKFVGKSKGFR